MRAKHPPVNVQRGLASVYHSGNNAVTTNVTIGDVGSLSRAKERCLGVTSVYGPFFATLRLTSATNLEIQTLQAGAASYVYVAWEVEAGDYIAQAQRGQSTYAFSTGGEYINSVTLTDLADLTQARCEMMAHKNNWNTAFLSGARVRLSSSSNLEARFFSGGNNVLSTNWLVYKVR